MCGIYACVHTKNAYEQVRAGIQRLDYRGYDSWGIGVNGEGELLVTKDVGQVPDSLKSLSGLSAIGHTRWATHGKVTVTNAHPHESAVGSFALVHNGIVENEADLRAELIGAGIDFVSETDSEVILRMIERKMSQGMDLVRAVEKVIGLIRGRNAVVILTNNGEVLAYRNGSPLLVGLSEKEQVVVASDVASMSSDVIQVRMMNDGELMWIASEGKVFEISGGKKGRRVTGFETVAAQDWQEEKGEYEDYMIKEICEIPTAVRHGYKSWSEQTQVLAKQLKDFKKLMIVGSGTAGIAAKSIGHMLRSMAKIDALGLFPEELGSYSHLVDADTAVILVSQSGETADVLEAIKGLEENWGLLVAYVNMPGSMMLSMADVAILAHAGPEKAVMSTKVFVSQLVWGYCLGLFLQGANGIVVKKDVLAIAQAAEELLDDEAVDTVLDEWTKLFLQQEHILMMGHGLGLLMLEEGRIKITEGAYMPTQAISAASLKHFAITLIVDDAPVLVNMMGSDTALLTNAVKEIQARGAVVLGMDYQPNSLLSSQLSIRATGVVGEILSVIPMQLLAYRLAKKLGNSPDKPRNIAKSVTVL